MLATPPLRRQRKSIPPELKVPLPTCAITSAEWLFTHLERPDNQVEAIVRHLGAGGDIGDCPHLTVADMYALVDLGAQRSASV
jgi:hypothetical protein